LVKTIMVRAGDSAGTWPGGRYGAPRDATDLPWRTARELAHHLARPVTTEQVGLDAAHGRVLGDPIRAAATMPGYDAAAMDGFAVAGPGPWLVVHEGVGGVVLAGRPGSTALAVGTAVEIATGAVIPAGTEAVVPYEQSRLDGAVLTTLNAVKHNIRLTGEDFRVGDTLAEAGREVTAAMLGLAAHAGLDELTVRRRPTVRLLITGDEVIRHGLPGRGQVRDAFGPMLAGLVDRTGAVVIEVLHVADGYDELAQVLRPETADVVVVTGSSSVGRADHLHPVLRAVDARIHVNGVACRPGHPQVLAETIAGGWVIGLPGNPYAGLVGYLTLLEPLLHGLLARTRPPRLALPVYGDVRPLRDATRLVPVALNGDRAIIVPGARPASLRAAAAADGVAVVEPDWVAGALTDVLRLE
jgi:molybdopterin molybdotransferase